MKSNFQNTILLFTLTLFLLSCDNTKPIDTTIFLANYERDKFVATDTTEYFRNTIDNSGGWTISLKNENQFTFRGTDKIINGVWSVDKIDGANYYVKFISPNDTIDARLNGTIIYFDAPNKLFDNLFKSVTFVQTTMAIDFKHENRDSLISSLIGFWGGELREPIFKITRDTIYFVEQNKAYKFYIDNGDMIIEQPEYKTKFSNIHVRKDTLFHNIQDSIQVYAPRTKF